MIPNLADAAYTYQAEPDSVDFEIVSAAHNAYGVASGCACTAASPGSTLGVAVALGSVHVGSTTPVAVTGVTVTPGAASGVAPRLDLIVVSNLGVVSVVAGTADATPVFPAIPANRTVIAAVAIPTSATSITNTNIVDKRQLLNLTPQFGTTSTTAAQGNHLHAGEYASTTHASTHRGDGTDPITEIGGVTVTPDDGTGAITFAAQLAGEPAVAPTDGHIKLAALWRGYRPVISAISADRSAAIGSVVAGATQLWYVQPNTGTTLASAMLPIGAATSFTGTSTPTVSHPAPTTALGFRTRFATAATLSSDFAVSTTNTIYARGDSVLPWCGYFFHARVAFPDASYNAAGATTGSRFFCGMTDIAAIGAAALGADDPAANNRHGFQRINVNGGKTQTNFFMTIKNTSTSTEALLDTGIALVQNHVYDFFIFIRPSGGYPFGEVRDLTAGTTSGSLIDISGAGSIPNQSAFMRAMVGLKTINATVRTLDVMRVGAEVAV